MLDLFILNKTIININEENYKIIILKYKMHLFIYSISLTFI